MRERLQRALRRRVEQCEALDGVDVEHHADEALRRCDVDHLAAYRELAGLLDHLHPPVAAVGEHGGEVAGVEPIAGRDRQGGAGQQRRLGEGVEQQPGRRDHEPHRARVGLDQGMDRRGRRAERRCVAVVRLHGLDREHRARKLGEEQA